MKDFRASPRYKSKPNRISRITIGGIQISKPGYGGKGKIWLQRVSGEALGEGVDCDEKHFTAWIDKYFRKYM